MKSELYDALAQRLQDAGLSEAACTAVDMIDAAYVIRAMQSRIEALEKDAARYRWLRDNGFSAASAEIGNDLDGDPFVRFMMSVHIPEPISLPYEEQEWTSSDINTAIDTAIQSEKGGV